VAQLFGADHCAVTTVLASAKHLARLELTVSQCDNGPSLGFMHPKRFATAWAHLGLGDEVDPRKRSVLVYGGPIYLLGRPTSPLGVSAEPLQ
jgi:hypothetical protein